MFQLLLLPCQWTGLGGHKELGEERTRTSWGMAWHCAAVDLVIITIIIFLFSSFHVFYVQSSYFNPWILLCFFLSSFPSPNGGDEQLYGAELWAGLKHNTKNRRYVSASQDDDDSWLPYSKWKLNQFCFRLMVYMMSKKHFKQQWRLITEQSRKIQFLSAVQKRSKRLSLNVARSCMWHAMKWWRFFNHQTVYLLHHSMCCFLHGHL